jgi:hypothetical protein
MSFSLCNARKALNFFLFALPCSFDFLGINHANDCKCIYCNDLERLSILSAVLILASHFNRKFNANGKRYKKGRPKGRREKGRLKEAIF